MIRAAVVALLMLAGVAHAETRRVAVIVGNNAGSGEQMPLRYAEIDAGKIGRVLVELGGVADKDLFLLQGKDRKTLDATLALAAARVAEYQKSGLDRVVLVFYYSGHSDGVALELGHERFTFAALRKWLHDTGAEVRVGLIDSCKSGALIATKGGTPGPAFQIRLTDDLASSGEALLTSSAANEDALESREIGGSFFTHHLVSGLRGAADVSGDARVTLTEAYLYAYKHTISTSGATLAGPQHPAYDFRLSGQGELILTELAQPSAALVVPDGFDRALIIEVARDQVIAELGRGAPAQVAVSPGRYGIRAWRGEQAYEGRVLVSANSIRAVKWDELHAVELPAPRAKGDVVVTVPPPQGYQLPNVLIAVGGRSGVAEDFGVLGGLRLGVRPRGTFGKVLSLDATTAGDGITRETNASLSAGYQFGVRWGRLRAAITAELLLGAVFQSSRSTASTGAIGAALTATVGVQVTEGIALQLETQVPGVALIIDGDPTTRVLPAIWLGTVITP